MSLGPAIAAITGYLILNQALTLTEALAVGLVVAASIGAVRSATAWRRSPSLSPARFCLRSSARPAAGLDACVRTYRACP